MPHNEDRVPISRYDPPVPDLGDHRHQIWSVQRPGLLDHFQGDLNTSGARLANTAQVDGSKPRARDLEGAVADDDASDICPGSRSSRHPSRRPTFASSTRRTVSPPNSVKAFAEARRRGREPSVADPKEFERRDDESGKDGLDPNVRLGSGRSYHSRPYTTDRHSASLATNQYVEEDICYPVQREHPKDKLYIDFNYLETLIKSEREQPAGDAFPSHRPKSTTPKPLHMVTTDGDFINVPSEQAPVAREEDAPQSLHDTQQHAEQNRFNFFSSAWELTIQAAEFGDLALPGEDIRCLFRFPKGETDGVWWLNMNNPTGEEIRTICMAFGIHPLTIEDISARESREKIELFPSYYFACFRSFTCMNWSDGIDYTPFNVYVVVFREGTISFSFTSDAHASRVRLRISQLEDQVSLSSDWICYALIDDIVDSFAPAIKQIEREADAIEDQVFITRPNDNQEFLRRIGLARKNVIGLMRLLGGKADILRAFAKRCNKDYNVTPHMDIGLYLGDIQDHVVTMMNNIVQFETILSRSYGNYLAQLSIDKIDQGNQANGFLSRVTVMAAIIVPLLVISGLFGMNVRVPWQDENNLNTWLGIISVIILFALTSLLVARWMRYI